MTEPDEEFIRDNHLAPQERDIEAPDADAAEQATAANPAEDRPEVHRGMEVSEWDAVEQSQVVDLDEDYR